MRVVSVNYNGFDKLYQIYKGGEVGKHLDQILNHVEIDLHMDSLTMMEAFFIKNMLGPAVDDMGASLIESDEDYERIFPEKSFPDMKPSLKSVVEIMPDLDNDADIAIKPGPMILPCGMVSREILVKLSGHSLMIIFNNGFAPIWKSLFCDADGKPLPVNARPSHIDLTNEAIKQRLDNYCIQAIITELYKTMNESLTTIDREADAYIYDSYYKYTERNLDCAISEIVTPVGSVEFFGNEKVNETIADVKSKLTSDKYLTPHLARNIKINFTCISSMYTMMELMLALPPGTIVDYSDININLASDEILVSRSLSKYKTRVVNKMKIFNAIKVELSRSKEFPLHKYNFILLNSVMRYNITVTGEKLMFLSDFLIKINSGAYGRQDSSLCKELRYITDTILQVSDSMKKVLLG